MFLLIHGLNSFFNLLSRYFTFHNVSINTKIWQRSCSDWNPLHSIMFLLIRRRPEAGNWICKTLHSIMFLLIPFFQTLRLRRCFALHSIMFLLIRNPRKAVPSLSFNFTFHNVSINTFPPDVIDTTDESLHSIMFLLIQCWKK